MSRKPETWSPTDHACRECGGRVVRVIGHGPTGGGNPIWRCADCGIASAAMGPECICWCGFRHKGQASEQYQCVNVKTASEDKVLRAAIARAGYGGVNGDRHKCEVAVLTVRQIEWAAANVTT